MHLYAKSDMECPVIFAESFVMLTIHFVYVYNALRFVPINNELGAGG